MSKHNDDLNPKLHSSLASGLPDDDKRLSRYRKQRDERGFDDTETWSLDTTIASFIAPRMKRYLEVSKEMIVLSEEHQKDITDLAEAFEFYGSDESYDDLKKRKQSLDKIRELFPKVFNGGLWW